jgi:death-on-curing protein
VKRLSLAQVKALHALLVVEVGSIAGIRSEALLERIVDAPFRTFDGEDVYRGLEAKAVRLAYGIITGRPFRGGNERTGLLAMLTLMEINGVSMHCGDDDIVDAGIALASEEMTQGRLLQWIRVHR